MKRDYFTDDTVDAVDTYVDGIAHAVDTVYSKIKPLVYDMCMRAVIKRAESEQCPLISIV